MVGGEGHIHDCGHDLGAQDEQQRVHDVDAVFGQDQLQFDTFIAFNRNDPQEMASYESCLGAFSNYNFTVDL